MAIFSAYSEESKSDPPTKFVALTKCNQPIKNTVMSELRDLL